MHIHPRWLVPVAVVALIGGGTAASSAVASGPPQVPAATPEQVLATVAGSQTRALSGTIATRTELGLPDLSSVGGLGGSGGPSGSRAPGDPGGVTALDPQGLAMRFLTGENTLRVWVDGPQRQKVQLLDPMDELDVVRNGSELWTYSAKANVVGRGTAPTAGPEVDRQLPTPQTVARQALEALDPTTEVTLGTPATVAGRATYTLVLTPATTATLVDRVVINVDAANGVPLRTGIYARGQSSAAVLTGFTSVSFATPAASVFQFTPPATATVTTLPSLPRGPKPGQSAAPSGPAENRPTVTGSGWSAIVQTAPNDSGIAAMVAAAAAGGGSQAGALQQLTTPVPGGRAISTALVSVLLTDDGRVLAGSVPVQALLDAAQG